MSVEQFEGEVLELAVRRVRTPEGAQFYGLPIGAPITADVIEAKKAEAAVKGLTPPEGALTSGKGGSSHMAGTISGKTQAEKEAAKASKGAPKLNIKVKKSTLTGNKHFSVGKSKYTAPNGSKLIKPASQPGMVYVVTPDGEVHAFNEAGEIEIPKTLKAIFQNKFNTDFEGDENYSVEEFEATSASVSLDSLKTGSVLNDKRGNPQFKKLADDTWEHVDLGVKLKDADIQETYDSGDLIPDTENDADNAVAEETFANTEAMNFGEMSTSETVAALDAMEPGQKVTLKTSDATRVFTKQDDGTWLSDGQQANGEPFKPSDSDTLAYVKDYLHVGAEPEPEYNPLDVDTTNPLDTESKKLVGVGDTPDDEWLDNSLPGAQITFTSDRGSKTIWNKQEDGSWLNQKGGSMSAQGMKDNYKVGGSNLKITKEGKAPTTPSAPQPEAAPEAPPSAFDRPSAPEPTQRSSSSLTPGEGDYTDLSSPDEVENATIGDKVLVSFDEGSMVSEYELQPNGAWLNVDDSTESLGYVTMKALASNDGPEKVYKNQANQPETPESSDSEDDLRTPVTSTDLAFQDGMVGLDIWNEESEHYIIPGQYEYSDETVEDDILNAQPGDKILVAFDPDFEEDGGLPHYEASDLLEKQPDGSWKNLAHPTVAVTEDDLITHVVSSEGQYDAEQLYTFSGNSTKAGQALDSDVSQNKEVTDSGTAEDELAGGDAQPGGPGGVPEGVGSASGDDGSGDSGSDGGGVVLSDGYAPPLLNDGKPLELDSRTQALKDQGIVVAELFELDAKGGAFDAFYSSISKLKENNPYHASVYVYPEGEYGEMRLFLNSDGTAGVALKGDEIVSVFVHPDSKDKGSARSLISQAVAQGGKRLDAYDTVLPKIYAKEGFVPVARTAWDDEYAPEGWDKALYSKYNNGSPDVVFMAYDPASVDSDYDPNGGMLVASYDEGVELAKNYSPSGAQNASAVPDGVPEGSSIIQQDSEVSPGQHVYEVMGDGSVVHSVKQDNGFYQMTLPSGLVMEDADSSAVFMLGGNYYLAPNDAPEPEEVPEWELALMEEPLPSGPLTFTSEHKVGDVIQGVEGLDAQAPGTKLAYTKKDGTQSFYVKLDNGSWLTPGGGVMESSQLKGSANSGKFKIESLPEASALAASPQGYVDGDTITKFGHLRDMEPGTVISEYSFAGNWVVDIQKQEDGSWHMVPNEKFPMSGSVIEPSELGDAISDKRLRFKSSATAQPSTDLDTQLWTGAPAMSQAQLSEALKGLEEHTSFHVSYGLKSLPDGHPLKNADTQEALKIAALNKYPDLKAKPAVMQLLKDGIGIEEGGPVDDSPKVWIGSKTPKSTGVQGMDGGEFTSAEIQKAIDILESFQGKTFKAELNKKGSPLGSLNPNSIVGFDKDKTVTKQKLIDLLKTKLVVTEEDVKHPVVKDMEEFNGLAVGTQVSYTSKVTGNKQVYTKIGYDQWSMDDGGHILPSTSFESFVKDGGIRVEKKPDVLPEYAKTPAAVQDKQVTEEEVENFGPDDVASAEVGTILEGFDDPNPIYLVKNPPSNSKPWTIVFHDGSQGEIGFTDNEVKAIWEPWKLGLKQQDGPNLNENSGDGIVPGKYMSKGGKAYMVVNADGTGIYVNTKGDVKNLTAKGVKSNYDAGMKDYQGVPDSIPAPTEQKKTPAKPKAVGDIADGVYYAGKSNDPKTTVYEVSGDSVKVYKPTTVSGYKIGQAPDSNWADEASVGAAFNSQGYWSYGESKSIPGAVWTKGVDGLWHPDNDELKPTPFNEILGLGWGSKIKGHGLSSEPTTISKTKANTLFSQGKFLDADGNSVVPDGYSGTVSLFGSTTTIPALLDAQESLNSDDIADLQEFQSILKSKNIYWDAKLVTAYTQKHFGEKSLENYKAAFQKAITDLSDGLDTDIPESDASGLFEWNSMGEAKMPLEVASMEVYKYNVSSTTSFIKAASKSIGDGKVIGQHYTKMGKYEKSQWVTAFQQGDFKTMYNLEVAAAAKEGKAHNAGYLHPGYSGNEATNKISWGAAVDGEVSALTEVPGEWTQGVIQPSLAEIDNYLIKAQMQNPTYLSNSEKRDWVKYHKSHNKEYVDKLSATAALRKKEGKEELSKPLVWTDDVKPAKLYDSLFDNTEFPLSWNNQAAQAYLDDNPQNAELQASYAEAQNQYGSYGAPMYGVQAYFQAKHDEAEAQKLIPVYTLDPSQTVKKSTHPVYNYTDQFGKKYFFKPRPNTKLDKYRSEVEHLGNQFGKTFGFSTADSKLIEIDGKYGQLQSDVGGVSDLMGYDYSTLTSQQIADIGSEHILDWFLDNDDTKGDNAKILPNGRIVGIDKGRAFKHFGAWKGLSGDGQMNSNANTIYSQLFDAIRAGKLNKEDVDKAYLAIQKKAEKMAKVPDSVIEEMLAEGMKNREQWDINYSIDGKKVPNNLAGLTAAVLDRKSKLPQDFETLWAKVYKDAGFGDLPEKPNNPLGDVISGLDDDRLHTEVFQAEATGKTAMIGGSHVIGGTALVWTDQHGDGTTNMNGEMFLAPKKQKELLDYFMSNATDMSASSAVPQGFGTFDKYGDAIIDGAKTVNHHAGDLNYNESKIDAFQKAKANIQSDLDEWTPTLESNSEVGGDPAYKFKSGTVVPMQHLSQYKMMLDHYQGNSEKVQKAYDEHGKVDVISKYNPLTLSKGGEKYTHSDGSSLTKLGNGQFIYVDGETNSVSVLKEGDANWYYVEDAVGDTGSWVPVEPSPDEKPSSGVTIVKLAKTHDQNAKIVDGHTKVLTGPGSVSGANGQEYEVTLPTGEKIYFRNADQTNTKRGQQGKLSFRVEGVSTPEETKAAMDRITQQLNAMGIDTDPSDHTTAELTYWREMYGILENRKHAANSKHAKAYAKMQQKVKEIGGNENEFLENLSEKLDPEAEVLYWRELYSEFWPDEVANLIATEGYLPKFDHQNLKNTELETGKPYWERFDVSLDDIYKTNKVLASSTGSDPLQLVLTGGNLSAEERLRQSDDFSIGGSWSPQSDQNYGSSHNIYTRIVTLEGAKNHNVVYNPKAMLRTRVYSFNSDNYGNLANRKSSSPSDPLSALNGFSGGSNETMLPHMATLLDMIEIYAFDYAEKRNEAIQYLKKLGIEKIRGVPVEDRLVMRSEMKAAIDKLKKTWAQEALA